MGAEHRRGEGTIAGVDDGLELFSRRSQGGRRSRDTARVRQRTRSGPARIELEGIVDRSERAVPFPAADASRYRPALRRVEVGAEGESVRGVRLGAVTIIVKADDCTPAFNLP